MLTGNCVWGAKFFKHTFLFKGEIRDSMVHIGQTTVPVYNPENRTKVPDVLFYENQQVRIPLRKSCFFVLNFAVLLQRERRRIYAMHALCSYFGVNNFFNNYYSNCFLSFFKL